MYVELIQNPFVIEAKKKLNELHSILNTIEDEQERYDQSRIELIEKLDVMKQKAQSLENVRL